MLWLPVETNQNKINSFYRAYLSIYVHPCMYILVTRFFCYVRDETVSVSGDPIFWSENVQGIQNHTPIGKEPRTLIKKNWSTIGAEIDLRTSDEPWLQRGVAESVELKAERTKSWRGHISGSEWVWWGYLYLFLPFKCGSTLRRRNPSMGATGAMGLHENFV